MGIVYTTLTLTNPVKPELQPMSTKALADTGAMHLCIPEHIALQLAVVEHEKREVTLADGSKRLVPYVGPLEVRFANRRCFVGAPAEVEPAKLRPGAGGTAPDETPSGRGPTAPSRPRCSAPAESGAMVMGDQVLLGAIPMEDMDLVVHPLTREVTVNPSSPNIPSSIAKGVAQDRPKPRVIC